jgi:hypothetical protein
LSGVEGIRSLLKSNGKYDRLSNRKDL